MPRTDPSAAPMLIKNIADKIQQDQVTFVVGAGMSTLANTINGEPFPSSVGLATSLATHFHLRLAPPDKTNLAYVAQVVETEHGRDALHTWLEHQLSFDPNAIPREHKVLMKLATRVVTTNYDTLLDEAARALAPTKTFRVIRRPVDCSSLDGPILIKAHGCITVKESVVITTTDYLNRLSRETILDTALRLLYAASDLVLLGFGAQDIDFLLKLNQIREDLGPFVHPLVAVMNCRSRVNLSVNCRVKMSLGGFKGE
jgi:hypothetical protein